MSLFSDSITRVDDPYLRHALSLAMRAKGATWPNPAVGCVVVVDGRIVGEGFHPRAGQPHAEVFALADAGGQARGADVYVTLEPCSHHGRTPPCAEALVAAGVRRVVIGMADPYPVAAGGAARLREAGIDVEFAPDPSAFAQVNEGWLKRVATGMPLVRVKVATSLDGRVAFERTMRASITGPAGATVTSRLRAMSDAVAVGAATVDADDPALTVRVEGHAAEHQPLRVVIARSRMPHADARIFTDGAAPTLVVGPDALDVGHDVMVARYDLSEGLAGALRAIADHGVGELLIEAGPALFSTLAKDGLIDELVTVTAGGVAGEGTVSLAEGISDVLDNALVRPFAAHEAAVVGDVSVTVWRPAVGDSDVQERKGS